MKPFKWNHEKNELLKKTRGISFEEIVKTINSEDGLVETIDHPNKIKYPRQRMFVVNLKNYIYLVPFVEDINEVFLKTVIPNKKATKKYLLNK